MTSTPDDDFMASVRTTIRDAAKLKAVMLKKELRQARAKCPECGGVRLYLVGAKYINATPEAPVSKRVT